MFYMASSLRLSGSVEGTESLTCLALSSEWMASETIVLPVTYRK